MPARRGRTAADRLDPPAAAGPRRWLLFVHQLPPTPSNLRVRTWRRLQDLGAVALKQAVYVLPDTPATREDFEWLKVDVESAGGEATVLSGETLDPGVDATLVAAFTRARDQDYAELERDLRRAARSVRSRARRVVDRRRRDDLTRARQRFTAIERIDFFGSPGRERAAGLLADLESGRAAPAPGAARPPTEAEGRYHQRLWVTRPRPGIDRMASAWLIRRFIDPGARFGFVTDPADAPDAVPFDMFGVAFSHEGGRCTFEVLQQKFAIADPAASRLAAIVHDLDLHDDRHGAPEAPTVAAAVEGLQLTHADDGQLIEQGMQLFEALYRSFSMKAGRAAAPIAPHAPVRPARRPRRRHLGKR
jgi:hypothetical protein